MTTTDPVELSLVVRAEFNPKKNWWRIVDGNGRLCGVGYRTQHDAEAAAIGYVMERTRQINNLRSTS